MKLYILSRISFFSPGYKIYHCESSTFMTLDKKFMIENQVGRKETSKFESEPTAGGFVVKEDLCEKRESHDGGQ